MKRLPLCGRVLFVLLTLLCVAQVANAEPIWTISGPGTTGVSQNGLVTEGTYSLNPAGYSIQSWELKTTAPTAGDYEFDWDYDGFHAYFAVTAFLDAFDDSGTTSLYAGGPQNCCTTPSAGFAEAGTFTFTGIDAGETFGFRFGGSNYDSTNLLQGTLQITQITQIVPEPPSIALWSLLGLGLCGFGYYRVRRKR